MKSEQQPTEGAEPFSLLIRIEKSNKLQANFHSVSIQIIHTNTENTEGANTHRLTDRKQSTRNYRQTSLKKKYETVWVQDFIYDQVDQSDTFTFLVSNQNRSTLCRKEFLISQMLPFLNTGELVTLTLLGDSHEKLNNEIKVSFSLFERRDPLAGVFMPQLNLQVSNKQWVWEGQKSENENPKPSYPPLCYCIDQFEMDSLTQRK